MKPTERPSAYPLRMDPALSARVDAEQAAVEELAGVEISKHRLLCLLVREALTARERARELAVPAPPREG